MDSHGHGTIGFAMTNVCNLRCRMCGSQLSPGVTRVFSDERVWKAAIQFVPRDWTLELNALGEHTTHPQFLEALQYLRAARSDLCIKLTTNGQWPFTTKDFLTAIRRKTAAVDHKPTVVFSIDGATEETYRHIRGKPLQPVLDRVRACIAEKEPRHVGIAFVAMHSNIHEPCKLIDALPGLTSFYLNVLHVLTPDMVDESIYGMRNEYTSEAEKIVTLYPKLILNVAIPRGDSPACGCSFPYSLWIDPQGDIFPCCRRYDLKLGNVVQDTFSVIASNTDRIAALANDALCRPCFDTTKSWDWHHHFASQTLFDAWTAHHTLEDLPIGIKSQ